MTGSSPIIRVVARFATPLSVLVAIQIFFQGHNYPGGGFIAGVLLTASGVIWLLAFGPRALADVVWWKMAVVGLIVSLLTGTVPLLRGHAFMDNVVLHLGPYHLPTSTFFELGVALIVVGTLMTIFVELSEERR